MDSSIAIKFCEVYKVFPGEDRKTFVAALKNINLQIKKGSLTIIGGANGSGKSVLMAITAGLMEPSSGTVETASKPGLIFQEASTQILGDTVEEDVAVGPRNLKINKKDIPHIVQNALSEVSLLEKKDFPAEFLSGGEKRRLAVASVLAMDRDILIFDEPYANLDYPGVVDVNSLIKKLHTEGKTILLLTHEIEKCLGMADNFIILYKGDCVFDGVPSDALKCNLSEWGIKNPLTSYNAIKDLQW